MALSLFTERASAIDPEKVNATTTIKPSPSRSNVQPWPVLSDLSASGGSSHHQSDDIYASPKQVDQTKTTSANVSDQHKLHAEDGKDMKRRGYIFKPQTGYAPGTTYGTVYVPEYVTETDFVAVVSTETDTSYVSTVQTQTQIQTQITTLTSTSTQTSVSTFVQPTTATSVSTFIQYSVLSGTIYSFTYTSVSTVVSSVTSTTTTKSTLTTTATSTLTGSLYRTTTVVTTTLLPMTTSSSIITVITNTIQTQLTPFSAMVSTPQSRTGSLMSASSTSSTTRAVKAAVDMMYMSSERVMLATNVIEERQSGTSTYYFSTSTFVSTTTVYTGTPTIVQPQYTSTVNVYVAAPTDNCYFYMGNVYETSGGLYVDDNLNNTVTLQSYDAGASSLTPGTKAVQCCERCLLSNSNTCVGSVFYPNPNTCLLIFIPPSNKTCNQQSLQLKYNNSITDNVNSKAYMSIGFCGSFYIGH